MKHERNVEGLRHQAEQRHKATLQRAKQGITQLLSEKRPVNFRAVSEVSQVSVAWLYRQQSIRQEIEQLREATSRRDVQAEAVANDQRSSAASRNAIQTAMRQRIKQLEEENQELKRQLEVSYGLVYQQGQLKI